jgi:hypothetical protein
MSITSRGRRVAPLLGLATAMIAVLALAPAAFAAAKPAAPRPQVRTQVNSFSYNAADATHHQLVFNATNTGTYGYQVFYVMLTQVTKVSNVMLSVGTTQYKGKCVALNGGFPAIECTAPTVMTPGTPFSISFTTSTVYPAGSTSMWFADDQTGAGSGSFIGPK